MVQEKVARGFAKKSGSKKGLHLEYDHWKVNQIQDYYHTLGEALSRQVAHPGVLDAAILQPGPAGFCRENEWKGDAAA